MQFLGFEPSPEMRAYMNVGFPFDFMSGTHVDGKHGEKILNGGLQHFTGISGGPNMYKSTLAHTLHLLILNRYEGVNGMTYDTEPPSCSMRRFHSLMQRIGDMTLEELRSRMLLTDITKEVGNKWFSKFQNFVEQKIKAGNKLMKVTPMLLESGELLQEMIANTVCVDSLSMMTLDITKNIFADNEIGESGANIEAMRGQMAKTQMIVQIPELVTSSNTFMIMTAHAGKTYQMDPRQPLQKQLTFMKQDIKLKNVPEKFLFLPNNLYHAAAATTLINKTTKAPEYPRSPEDDMTGDTDLMLVTYVNLRAKNGPTGIPFEIVVSQTEGFRTDLSALRYLKANEGYGMGGHDRSYYLEIYPDCKLSRTTVRGKCDADQKLRRALEITAELCQKDLMWHDSRRDYLCKPAELYEDIKAMGWDWDELLGESRGYWVYEDSKNPLKFLSTFDLLRMRKGEYVPKWFKRNKPEVSLPKAA